MRFNLSEVDLICLEHINDFKLLQHWYIQAFRYEFLYTLMPTLKSTRNMNIWLRGLSFFDYR